MATIETLNIELSNKDFRFRLQKHLNKDLRDLLDVYATDKVYMVEEIEEATNKLCAMAALAKMFQSKAPNIVRKDEACRVCRKGFNEIQFNCFHKLCVDCLHSLLRKNTDQDNYGPPGTCPFCRAKIINIYSIE